MPNTQINESMKISALIEVHNERAKNTDVKSIMSWKQSKAKLVEKIRALPKQAPKTSKDTNKATKTSKPKAQQANAGTDTNDEEAHRTVKEASGEYLSITDYYEDKTVDPSPLNRVGKDHKNARSVGLPYSEVLNRLADEFPEANTTTECLRWYCVKARAEAPGYQDWNLPQRRPRSAK